MNNNTLREVGEWAQNRIAAGEEPPWTFHKLKLFAGLALELAEGLEAGVAYTPGMDSDSDADAAMADNIVEFQSGVKSEEDAFTNLPA